MLAGSTSSEQSRRPQPSRAVYLVYPARSDPNRAGDRQTDVAGARPVVTGQHFPVDEETVVAHEGSQSSVLAAGALPRALVGRILQSGSS